MTAENTEMPPTPKGEGTTQGSLPSPPENVGASTSSAADRADVLATLGFDLETVGKETREALLKVHRTVQGEGAKWLVSIRDCRSRVPEI